MSFTIIGIIICGSLAFAWIFQGLYRLGMDWRDTKLENVIVEKIVTKEKDKLRSKAVP